MLSTARNAPVEARKGRTATVRPLTMLLSNSASNDNEQVDEAQELGLPPRIIATHWLRAASGEVAIV